MAKNTRYAPIEEVWGEQQKKNMNCNESNPILYSRRLDAQYMGSIAIAMLGRYRHTCIYIEKRLYVLPYTYDIMKNWGKGGEGENKKAEQQ